MSNQSEETTRQEPEVFIVQNVTRGPHVISDLKLTLGAFEVLDLTWEEEATIRKSRNLQESLNKGFLKRLTKEQYEKHLEQQRTRDEKEVLRQRQQDMVNQMNTLPINGKNVQVDTFDTEKMSKKQSAGLATNDMDYVLALDIAQADATLRGDTLTALEFADMCERDPNLVPRLLQSQNGTVSGTLKPAKAYYAQVGETFSEGNNIVSAEMQRKINRDAIFIDAPQRPNDIAFDNFASEDELNGLAEEIDLGKDLRK